MNEVTISKEELRDKWTEAMCEAREILTKDADDKAELILAVGMIGALIGAILIANVFEKGEEE